MKRVIATLKKALKLAYKYKYISLSAGALIVLALAGTIFLLVKHNPQNNEQRVAQITPSQPGTTANTQQTAPQSTTENTNKPSDQPSNLTSTTPSNTTTAPKPSSAPTQKSLVITPSSFTVKAGEWPPISIRSSDGTAINMPNFTGSNPGRLTFNFSAGPAKPNWVGSIAVTSLLGVGTYAMNVFAQDNAQAYYRGTITINIVKPTMNISVQSLGYDGSEDTVDYLIKLERLYGFNESVASFSYNASQSELGCADVVIDANTIGVSCYHAYGPTRPTNGSVTFTVSTATLSRNVTTTYSLPAE